MAAPERSHDKQHQRWTAAGAAAAAARVITDFSTGDRVSLSSIDANEGVDGNQAFGFIGASAFVEGLAAGKLRFDVATHMLYGSIDADADAEFAIQLIGVNALVAGNIVL